MKNKIKKTELSSSHTTQKIKIYQTKTIHLNDLYNEIKSANSRTYINK